MSDFVQGALVAGSFALAGAFATQVFNYFSQRTEREEQYRISLYPQRLAAYQQAVRRLVALQSVVFHSPPLQRDVRDRFQHMFREADDWWAENCLSLDPKSAETLRRLILDVGAWAVWDKPMSKGTPAEAFNEAWRTLLSGMGWKHVDPGIARAGLTDGR
jgi:hypothetical protein